MTTYNIWPIFTDENTSLFIKQRKGWLFVYNSHLIVYPILLIILTYIFWYISKNIEIYPYMDISLLNSINIRYIYLYTLDLDKSLLTLKSFWYNYNFLHFYFNFLFKDPINILRGYLHLFIYWNNHLFDNAVFYFLMDLDFLKNPYYYWSTLLSKNLSLYYIKELFALPAWPRFPRFWWYWTDDFYIPNYHSKLLKWFPKQDHYMILIMEALRPYIYSLIFYFSYLYWYSYNEYFLNLTESKDFMEWGFYWSSYNLGAFTKWLHLNRIHLIIFTEAKKIPQLVYFETIEFFDPELYMAQPNFLFFPRVTAFFINKLYLPIYLPVESFNLWFYSRYNGVLWLFSSSLNFHIHFLTLKEFSSLVFIIKEYIKHYYLLIQINYFFEYYSNSYYNFSIYLKNFYLSYIEGVFNWDYILRHIKLEIYKLKRIPKIDYYGVWSFKNLKHIMLFIIPYFWVLWAIFNLWRSYFYKDFWLFNIVWYNPTYLWNLFEVNQDIEYDYMLATEYFKKNRIKSYQVMYYGILFVFYWWIMLYIMNYILTNLEPYLGVAYYFVYPFNSHIDFIVYSWIIYVIVPFIIWRIYCSIFAFFKGSKLSFDLLYSKSSSLIVFFMFLFNLLQQKHNFNLEYIKYYSTLNNSVLNKYSSVYMMPYWDIKKYWELNQKNNFDLTNVTFFMYNNDKFKDIASNSFRQQLIYNSQLHMKFYNFSWLMVQSNHFYKYYDYIDHTRYSIKKLSDF